MIPALSFSSSSFFFLPLRRESHVPAEVKRERLGEREKRKNKQLRSEALA